MRIAIVGAGVSGLVAARGLHPEHEVTVFEANARIGGHTHTWDVSAAGRTWAVDSGFIVYNERNYPNFTRLLAELEVVTQPTTMSFSVRHDTAGLEYNGSSLRQLFVQRRNIVRPAFLRMIADILRFNRDAVAAHAAGRADSSLGELLDRGRYTRAFRDWYLLPMGSALWSISLNGVLDMPARFFVSFLDNHGMLTVNDRPQWRVVRGGSARYVEALTAPFASRIRSGHDVRSIARFDDRVEIDGEAFDRVVIACHSDQALEVLADATPAEREVLRAFPYQTNDAVLHTDTSVLPRARSAWGAWNYRVRGDAAASATVTYNMNELQSLDAPEIFCVTLNGREFIDPRKILGEVRYDHPMATLAGEAARKRHHDVSGRNRTHYCGAYWGNGFHESGVESGLMVAREIASAERSGIPAGVR